MEISRLQSDEAVLAELGARIAHRRIERQLTQAALAEQAGLAKRTVERIEGGASAQMSSLIRVFRVLDLLPDLDLMIPEAGPRPMEQLIGKGKVRRRASARGRDKEPGEPWSWADDE